MRSWRRRTSHEPHLRPSAGAFAKRLQLILDIQDDFARANEFQWGAAEAEALRDLNISRAEWHGVEGIARVITILSRRHGLNHCFLPDGGGLTITSASGCEGNSMLVMEMQGTETIVKPVRFTLERFPARQDLSYAVLETGGRGTAQGRPSLL